MSLKIFLSHAWNDKGLAAFKAIEARLDESGHEVWVDKHRIDYGESISANIEKGLREADVVLVLWSKHAHASADVVHEAESASRLGKLVVACKITDYDPREFPLFKDQKYFRFDGPRLEMGLLQLNQFLIRIQSRSNPALQGHEGLQAQIGALQDVLAEFDDWAFRKEKGHTGNEASGAYIDRMLEVGKRMVESGSESPEEKARLTGFFQKMQEVARKYPDPSQEALKNASIVTAIDEVDPGGESQMLQMFKSALAQNPQTRPAVQPPQAPKPPLVLQLEQHIAAVKQLPNAGAALQQRLAQILGSAQPQQIAELERGLLAMVDAVPELLQALAVAGTRAQVGHLLEPLLQYVAQHFLNPNDLIPEQHGTIGLLDDVYLANAFIFQINAVYASQTGVPLINVDVMDALNTLRVVLGPLTQQLDQTVVQSVNQVVQQAYYQQFAQGRQAGGITIDPERGSWGGTMEDEIARVAAKLGVSYP